MEKTATVVTANASMNRSDGRRSGYVAHSGATMSDANLLQPDSAPNTPRPAGDDASQKPKMRRHGMIASFVFEFDAYCVNGYAAHANASVAASRAPPKRRPTRKRPIIDNRSNRIDVKCTEGRLSHFPLQPNARKPGMYASYAVGPYVSPSGFADSQRPFVWMRLRISPELSAGPQAGRLSSTGKFPHGAWP